MNESVCEDVHKPSPAPDDARIIKMSRLAISFCSPLPLSMGDNRLASMECF